MNRLRLLLAWLVMAALPLQGFAAATMLFCGMEQAATGSRGVAHDHAKHSHSGTAVSASAHDHAAHAPASTDHAQADSGSGGGATAGQDKQGHACPVCASCCHVVAVGGFAQVPQTAQAVSAKPSSPIVRVVTRTSSLPDKPPRA